MTRSLLTRARVTLSMSGVNQLEGRHWQCLNSHMGQAETLSYWQPLSRYHEPMPRRRQLREQWRQPAPSQWRTHAQGYSQRASNLKGHHVKAVCYLLCTALQRWAYPRNIVLQAPRTRLARQLLHAPGNHVLGTRERQAVACGIRHGRKRPPCRHVGRRVHERIDAEER